MAYIKPQYPLKSGENYIYPPTTADQVIVGDGKRLSGVGVYLDKPDKGEETTVAGINADTLGGILASEYVTQSELNTMNITCDRIVMPDGNKWDGTLGKTYTAGNGITISENGVISLALEYAEGRTF